MKRLLATIMTMLAIPIIASATDFTDTDQMYGWNGSTQIWQTWADHKTQLGLLFYTESEIDVMLAAIVGSGEDGEYGISLMSNTSTFAPQSGYNAGFSVIGNNPYAYYSAGNHRLQLWDADLDLWAAISPATGNIATTGTITGKIATATDADAHTLTEAEYHGGSVLATGAGIYTLPAAAAGLSGCVEAGQGVTAIIQLLPGSGDYIVKAGVRGTVATSLKSSGAAGDKICYIAYDADDWYVQTVGTWAE